jgi:RNA polymerase sigma-70 factor (ECF subfamily)
MAFLGDLEDFGAFYEHTYPVAYRTAWAILRDSGLAADAVQDAYLSAYRDRRRFRGDAPARSWLLRIVVNAALATARRPRPRLVAIDGIEELVPAPTDDFQRAADHLALDHALRGLDARSRAAVVLRYYVDMDYAEIAQALGTNANHVGVILHRALERLERELRRPEGTTVALAEVQHG